MRAMEAEDAASQSGEGTEQEAGVQGRKLTTEQQAPWEHGMHSRQRLEGAGRHSPAEGQGFSVRVSVRSAFRTFCSQHREDECDSKVWTWGGRLRFSRNATGDMMLKPEGSVRKEEALKAEQ